jgi:hypothetical protein
MGTQNWTSRKMDFHHPSLNPTKSSTSRRCMVEIICRHPAAGSRIFGPRMLMRGCWLATKASETECLLAPAALCAVAYLLDWKRVSVQTA